MKIEPLYIRETGHTAYYLESGGEAALFDVSGNIYPFLEKALKHYAKIRYIFQTDFRIGNEELYSQLVSHTGAAIVFGPGICTSGYGMSVNDGKEFRLGNYKIKLLYTPGNSTESTCFILTDENGNEHGIITGETLLIGDIGKPNLHVHRTGAAKEKMMRMLYKSLSEKILPLKDLLIIYSNPKSSGAKSKALSWQMFDTLGHQKKVNYALQYRSEDEFVQSILNIAV